MIRVCVIGAGYFAQYQIAAWRRLDGVDLVGVADLDPAKRDALIANHPDLPVFETSAGMLETAKPDLLDIATPPSTHADLIRAHERQVASIICQKPFCNDLETAQAVLDDLPEARIFVHENFRFQPWYREIKRLIDAGQLGQIRQARFAFRPGDGAGADAYLARQAYFREMERFLVHETGIHYIDTFRYLFGEPTAVWADLFQSNPAITGEDSGTLLFTMADGLRVTWDANRTLDMDAHNPRLTMGAMEVEGTNATLRLSGDGVITTRQHGTSQWKGHTYDFTDLDFGGNCVELFQRHMVAVLNGQAAPETRARDYLQNLRIEEAVYLSSQQGRRIALDASDKDASLST